MRLQENERNWGKANPRICRNLMNNCIQGVREESESDMASTICLGKLGHSDSRRKLGKKESEFGFKVVVSVGYSGRDPNKQSSSKRRVWPGRGHSRYDIRIPSRTSTGYTLTYRKEEMRGQTFTERGEKIKK